MALSTVLLASTWIGIAIWVLVRMLEPSKSSDIHSSICNSSGNYVRRDEITEGYSWLLLDRDCKSAERVQAEHNEKEESYWWWSTILYLATAIAAIVSVIYVGETFYLTRKNFQADERAYILPQNTDGSVTIRRGQIVRWDFSLINFGKTPSDRTSTERAVWFGKSALNDADEFFNKLPVEPLPGGDQIPPNFNITGSHSPGYNYVTAVSKDAITDSDIIYLDNHENGIVMAGRTWYTDIFGVPHYTDFCKTALQTHAITFCPRHNEMH